MTVAAMSLSPLITNGGSLIGAVAPAGFADALGTALAAAPLADAPQLVSPPLIESTPSSTPAIPIDGTFVVSEGVKFAVPAPSTVPASAQVTPPGSTEAIAVAPVETDFPQDGAPVLQPRVAATEPVSSLLADCMEAPADEDVETCDIPAQQDVLPLVMPDPALPAPPVKAALSPAPTTSPAPPQTNGRAETRLKAVSSQSASTPDRVGGDLKPAVSASHVAAIETAFAERLPEPNGTTAVPNLLASAIDGTAPRSQPVMASARNPSLSAVPDQPIVTARPGHIGREMGVEIARRLSSGGDELTVRLNPAEMGRIEVRLSFDDRGSLRAVVAAESAVALDMLRRDSADLGRALTDAGVRADTGSFRFDSRSGQSEGGQFWQRQQQTGSRTRNAAAPGDEPAPIIRPLRTSGRLDLMA